MTKKEAIAYMREGLKVTHRYFTSDEWMTRRPDGKIELEDGVVCSEMEFWRWRTDASWDEGYSLWEK